MVNTLRSQVVPFSYYQVGAEAASVSSPPVYPTPCIFLEYTLFMDVTGNIFPRIKLASYEDEQTELGVGGEM